MLDANPTTVVLLKIT